MKVRHRGRAGEGHQVHLAGATGTPARHLQEAMHEVGAAIGRGGAVFVAGLLSDNVFVIQPPFVPTVLR